MSFKGDTMSCLQHLYSVIKDDDYITKRKIIARVTGVGDRAVSFWFEGNSEPNGEAFIRLRYYLEFNGYEVTDFLTLDPTLKEAGKLLAFGVVSIKEMSSAVGYHPGRNGIDSLLKVLRGTQGLTKPRRQQFCTLLELYQDQLAKNMQETIRVVKQCEKIAPTKPMVARAPLRMVARPTPAEHEAIISSLASMVTAMRPLAHLVSSDSFSPEDRAKVRELSGNEGVFDLANTLFSICGERSRTMRQQ